MIFGTRSLWGGRPKPKDRHFLGPPPQKNGFLIFFSMSVYSQPPHCYDKLVSEFASPPSIPPFWGGTSLGGGSGGQKLKSGFWFFGFWQCCCTLKVQQMSFWSTPPSPLRSPLKNVFNLLSFLYSSCVVCNVSVVCGAGHWSTYLESAAVATDWAVAAIVRMNSELFKLIKKNYLLQIFIQRNSTVGFKC